jgi:hypothetical protein
LREQLIAGQVSLTFAAPIVVTEHFNLRHRLEQFAGHMRPRSEAGGSHRELSRIDSCAIPRWGTCGHRPAHQAGKLRALAVTTPTRSHLLPEVPPMKDFLPGYQSGGFFGIGAPKSTPLSIVDRLNREINGGLVDIATKARFAEAGVATLGGTPGDFRKLIAEETEKWARVIRIAGIKAS